MPIETNTPLAMAPTAAAEAGNSSVNADEDSKPQRPTNDIDIDNNQIDAPDTTDPTIIIARAKTDPFDHAADPSAAAAITTTNTFQSATAQSRSHDDDDDQLDFSHLADNFQRPLFALPAHEPSPKLRAAYRAQAAAKNRHASARKQRADLEASAAERLGRLHNAARESQEREDAARAALRGKSHAAFDVELQEGAERNEFVGWMRNLKAFVKKYRDKGAPGPPPTLARLEEYESEQHRHRHHHGPDDHPTFAVTQADKDVAAWMREQQSSHERNDDASIINRGVPSGVPPHHLAAMENCGVSFKLSEEDSWHRFYDEFRQRAREYWDNPLEIQITLGDLMRHITECSSGSGGGGNEDERRRFLNWVKEQQVAFENNALQANGDHYTKLVNAGFAFDVITEDERWNEHVDMIKEFKEKFDHVHVPEGYRPPNCPTKAPKLKSLVDKLRTVIHRDALSPKRMLHLKEANLYASMGGEVYEWHVQACIEGRNERGETQRIKRKFEVLEVMAKQRAEDKRLRGNKPIVKRGNMDNWAEKLNKLAAHVKEHNTIEVKNDVKLRGWTFSIVRKLSINSPSLHGEKMKLIYEHEGLREFLLRKDHVKMAIADAREVREKAERVMGEEEEEEHGSKPEQEQELELEELAEDVLLGHKEDDEVNAFMESGLQVPTV